VYLPVALPLLPVQQRGSDTFRRSELRNKTELIDAMHSIASMLVIDDNTDALATFNELFTALGVKNICRAASAEEALEILQTRSFAMIVCDYRLEGMDGVEFLEELRAGGNQTPVVMVSGAPDKLGVIRATQHPRVNFFGKPFRVDELIGAMKKLAEAA
jgi:DNA-binding NtrC family response regulator